MTIDEALKVAEEACRFVIEMEDGDLPTGGFLMRVESAAAALARLRAELPELIADTRALQMRFGISSSLFDGKVFDQLDAILARLEEGEGT